MAKNDLFRKSALDRMSSPDQLNDYIKLCNPSIWVVLAAILILLAAVFVWGFLGTLPTTISANGIAVDGNIVCYLSQEDAASVETGMEAEIGVDVPAVVSGIGSMPLSYTEASHYFTSDYAIQSAGLAEWNIEITLRPETAVEDGQILPVKITAGEIRPIDFIIN